MPDIQKITAITVPVEISIEGIKIKFKVSPAAASDSEFRQQLNQLSAEIRENQTPGELRSDHRDYEFALASTIKQWDLTSDGQPLPISEEGVRLLPDAVKVAMWEEATEALAPKNLIRRTLRTTSQRGG
jgi:hypothetical protein